MKNINIVAERITDNLTVILVKPKKNYLLKICLNNYLDKKYSCITIDKFEREESAIYHFRKVTERLRESIKKTKNEMLAIIEFLP